MPYPVIPADNEAGDPGFIEWANGFASVFNRFAADQAWANEPYRRIPKSRTYYGDKADTTSMPAILDTGEAVSYMTIDDGAFKILDGKKTMDQRSTSGNRTAYQRFADVAGVRRIGFRFLFDITGKSTSNGVANVSLCNKELDFSDTTVKIGVHLTVGPTYVEFTKFRHDTDVFTRIDIVNFPAQINMDGLSEFVLEAYWHDDDDEKVTIVYPHGLVRTYDDADFATWCGNYGFNEILYTAPTDQRVGIVEEWYDSESGRPPRTVPIPYPMAVSDVLDGGTELTSSPAMATASGSGADVTGLSCVVRQMDCDYEIQTDFGCLEVDTDVLVAVLQIVRVSDGEIVAEKICPNFSWSGNALPLLSAVVPAGTPFDSYQARAYRAAGSGVGTLNANSQTMSMKAVRRNKG